MHGRQCCKGFRENWLPSIHYKQHRMEKRVNHKFIHVLVSSFRNKSMDRRSYEMVQHQGLYFPPHQRLPQLRGRWPCNKEHGNIIRKYFQQYNHPSLTRSRRHSRYKEHDNILFWKHSKNRMELIHLKPIKQLKEATYKPWIFSSATYDLGTSNRRLLPI
jgi:hypothetical protein